MLNRRHVDPNFMSREAPPNYVAGVGRGATGFTTRSDIGEAVIAPPSQSDPAASSAADADDGGKEQDPDNETGLFSSLPYEADDQEADRIYDMIDQKMAERGKSAREAREREQAAALRKDAPKIQQQFSDLKRQLSSLSNEEWANIPEVGDLTRKKARKNKMADRFTPVPDSVLLSSHRESELSNTLAAASANATAPSDAEIDAMESQIAASNATPDSNTDFAQFGQARDRVLGLKLDQIKDSVSGSSTVDPKGYLTSLGSIAIKSNAEISDIKKARGLLQSVINTNPTHAPGWIAAARLEEVAGKQVRARELADKGCQSCPKSEDMWLEAARLNTPANAKVILANAVRSLPQSVNIWIKAATLETETPKMKKVLRRALEFIPNSVKLWKEAINLEDDAEDARILLSRATECVPLSVELWLALARLETYKNAQKVLNKARSLNKTSPEIWIAAARLEDSQGNESRVEIVIKNAVKILTDLGSNLEREQWISEAEKCEANGSILTCQAIIRTTIGIGVEDVDRKSTWIEDAEGCTARASVATARAIYAHAITVFPQKKSIWRRAAFFEKANGTSETLVALLLRAVKAVPVAEVLWLMLAKEKWITGDVTGARGVLEEAYLANPSSEQIWLAVIKLEVETGNFERGRDYLRRAREKADTPKVWMKSAMLERQLGEHHSALEILQEGLKKYPQDEKLWMIKGQLHDLCLGDVPAAREAYSSGLKQCPSCVPLWIMASRLEEKAGLLTKARPLLERARLVNEKEDVLWCEAIRLERRDNNVAIAKSLLSKALQECPTSGLIWSEAILMEARPQRKARSADAVRKCENNALVVCTIARLFFAEGNITKARTWFNKATKIDPDLGDAWAWTFRFETVHGDETARADVASRCAAADPKHGELWQPVSKDVANTGKSTEEILEIVALQCNETFL